MKNKTTPGPWFAKLPENPNDFIAILPEGGGASVAMIEAAWPHDPKPMATQNAYRRGNAALIAAAPDMRTALDMVYQTIKTWNKIDSTLTVERNPNKRSLEVKHTLKLIDHVILCAEGKRIHPGHASLNNSEEAIYCPYCLYSWTVDKSEWASNEHVFYTCDNCGNGYYIITTRRLTFKSMA